MILETRGLSKRFGSFYALCDVDFSIKEGEIHGLIGENGAGKSTLIKILTGVYSKTSGEIFVSGKRADISSPPDARTLGISVVHQDRNLVPFFSAVENVYLGLETPKKGLSVDFKAMEEKTKEVMRRFDISIPLDKKARDMSPAEKTMLEIVRAVMTDVRLLIMDEPTASLTDKETVKLFSLIRKLNEEGAAILYVSHRLEEVLELSERVTVLKNGRLAGTLKASETDKESLVSLMSDNYVSRERTASKNEEGEELFRLEHLSTSDGSVKDVSFSAKSGEITGLFGLTGSGRTETLEAIYGLRGIKSGKISFEGKEFSKPSPSKCLKEGIVLIHEDRRGHSLVTSRSVKDNIVLSLIDNYSGIGVYQGKRERKDAKEKMKKLGIQARSEDQKVSELSGGNQQKVVFARALMSSPKVFLCDEPTQGVDVKTRSDIHELLRSCARAGSAVVYVTSDLKEMMEVADTITIISGGVSRERLENSNLSSAQVLTCCYKERA